MTSGKSAINPRTSGTDCLLEGFGNVKWGLEVRELTLDCQGCQGNDASITDAQDFLCQIIGTHFLIIRPELTAICTWLSHETLNMQSPAGVNPGGAKEVLLRATHFSKRLSCEPRNLN